MQKNHIIFGRVDIFGEFGCKKSCHKTFGCGN